MKLDSLLPSGRNKRLIFRSYLIIVIGIVGFGLLLDFLLARNIAQNDLESDQSTRVILASLIENRFSQTAVEDLQTAASQMEAELNLPVELLASKDVSLLNSQPVNSAGHIGYTDDAQALFYYYLPQQQTVVTIGPLPESEARPNNWVQRLVPILFYLTVLALVWVWIRPLLRDLNLLSDAADNIKDDFRHPMPDFGSVTTIKPLADGFESMTRQLRTLIESQKEFSNAISHEVRTPLARIKFSLAAIDQALPPSLAEQSAEIHNNVNEIDQLLDAMLRYARLEHPDTIVAWQSLEVEELLVLMQSNQRPASMIDITYLGASEQGIIVCDPHLIILAVSNLIENAMRYANRKIQVSIQVNSDEVSIVVEDDGDGIAEDQHQTALKAFSSIPNADPSKSGGYGLGLAIVKRIAELHNGNLEISTASLGGAKMCIHWPVISIPRNQ